MSSWRKLSGTPLPAIAARRDGTFVILAKAAGDLTLVRDPVSGQPLQVEREAFEAQWSGRLVLVARRLDISWFMRAMQKYRALFGEVLSDSLFLQVLALISPLFFQVIIDKVLVHRGLTTLDILGPGLVMVSVFEAVLGALRTHVFAHTTNRIDVELGTRLYTHLMGLPIAYFESRRAGDSVARVRELESIRDFLTGSSLTLVVDRLFAFVVVVVMFIYSATFTFIVPDLYRHFGWRDSPISPEAGGQVQ